LDFKLKINSLFVPAEIDTILNISAGRKRKTGFPFGMTSEKGRKKKL